MASIRKGRSMEVATTISVLGKSICRAFILNRSAYWMPTLINGDGVPQKPVNPSIYAC